MIDIKFKLHSNLYNRDPQDTELGKKIIKNSILLIDQIGFEAFTFKKLAYEIGSAEKSVYRYFENKHSLLLFLSSWYWEWVHYLIRINLKNISDPEKKLEIAITNIVKASSENTLNQYINENLLHKVIISEGAKSYHTYAVDKENEAGLFKSYKSLVGMVADIIKEVNPSFPYCESVSSNLFEMANNQIYFAEHLPKMTSLKNIKKVEEELIVMMIFLAKRMIVD